MHGLRSSNMGSQVSDLNSMELSIRICQRRNHHVVLNTRTNCVPEVGWSTRNVTGQGSGSSTPAMTALDPVLNISRGLKS